jgi:hypothetical protein
LLQSKDGHGGSISIKTALSVTPEGQRTIKPQ